MTDDQVRALLIVAALWSGVVGSGGFVGGRMSVTVPPQPPPEVRYVPIFSPVVQLPAEPIPVEPEAMPPAPVAPIEPPAAAPVEVKPLPPARPKAEAKPKAKPQKARAPVPFKKSLPACAVVQREYNAMTVAQRWAAYRSATPEQVAHGKRCLGF